MDAQYGCATPTGARSGTKCKEGNGCFSEKSTRLKSLRGWEGGFRVNWFQFLAQYLMPERPFPLHNPRPPIRVFASLTGNTLPVRNVINGLDHARIFICKWLCIVIVLKNWRIRKLIFAWGETSLTLLHVIIILFCDSPSIHLSTAICFICIIRRTSVNNNCVQYKLFIHQCHVGLAFLRKPNQEQYIGIQGDVQGT